MIGLFGIVAREDILLRTERQQAFNRMSDDVEDSDFTNHIITGRNFSIGLTIRNNSENKDLQLSLLDDNFVIGFSGYGKFRNDSKFFWADQMVPEIGKLLKIRGVNVLNDLEGSFECLIFRDDELIYMSDRFGSKNFYYCDTETAYVFASYVGRIISSHIVKKEKSYIGELQILISGYFLDNSTLVDNIYRFPNATIMNKNLKVGGVGTYKRYWDYPKSNGSKKKLSNSDLEAFTKKFRKAIYDLAGLETKFTVPLSGGLDSRAIACFLSEKFSVKTITYDLKDEAAIAKKVCKKLDAVFCYFSSNMLSQNSFSKELKKLIQNQRIHAVVNQYFYMPMFKKFFNESTDSESIFDGVYLDILFNDLFPRFINKPYNFEQFFGTFGGKSIDMLCSYLKNITKEEIITHMQDIYGHILDTHLARDNVARNQLFYSIGRLRNYVCQSVIAKENYCYVLKPGFNYDLADFAFSLDIKHRKGILYKNMLFNKFPEVMKVKYKDSYGNRNKTFYEKILEKYVYFRLRLFDASNGFIKYSPYQINQYFVDKNEIDKYKELFLDSNSIEELISSPLKEKLFYMTKKKSYMLNIFQRVLFLQQFYAHYFKA